MHNDKGFSESLRYISQMGIGTRSREKEKQMGSFSIQGKTVGSFFFQEQLHFEDKARSFELTACVFYLRTVAFKSKARTFELTACAFVSKKSGGVEGGRSPPRGGGWGGGRSPPPILFQNLEAPEASLGAV